MPGKNEVYETKQRMDSRYTGVYPPTREQQRQETVAYYTALEASKKRNATANAYLAQQGVMTQPHARKQEYRCERCGI
jgi:hypothetical protein